MKKQKTDYFQQIDILQHLNQQAAAWLLGFRSGRQLRDLIDVPRNKDGSYNAKDLLSYAARCRAESIFSLPPSEAAILCAVHCNGLESYIFGR